MATAAPEQPADTSRSSFDAMRGVYDARRAAALSGVPKRTLTWWAQKGYYCPSISPEPRPRLWSWYDLVALRTIDWLRQSNDGAKGVPFQRIREALGEIDRRGLSRADLHELVVKTESGMPYLHVDQRKMSRFLRRGEHEIRE
jgi:DNA-binding transcriptional MerR regulator